MGKKGCLDTAGTLRACFQQGGAASSLSAGVCWGFIPGKQSRSPLAFSRDYSGVVSFCARLSLQIFKQITVLRLGLR